MNEETKEKVEAAGCIAWVLIIIALASLAGWYSQRGLATISWMPRLFSVVLSVIIGIVAAIVGCIISWLVAVMVDPEWDKIYSDFDAQ